MSLDRVGDVDFLLTDLWIGGKAVSAADGGRFDVLDPATGEVIASVANGTVADGLAAVEAAQAAMGPWSRRGPRERAEVLRRQVEFALPADLPYPDLASLSTEARQKLDRIPPPTLRQAARIHGINPSDLQNLVMEVRKRRDRVEVRT